MGKNKNKQETKDMIGEEARSGNGLPEFETRQKKADKRNRLPVSKTYKLYIGGAFPRSESGRYYKLKDKSGRLIANVSRASRKDLRMAVVAARKAQPGWEARSAYNRGQIIYRIAEMLEWRRDQFVRELVARGVSESKAVREVEMAIDRTVYYAGWADKYQQIFSSVNPIASPHFNFSLLEPMGVITVFSPEDPGLLGLISAILPAITGCNTAIALASRRFATACISFAEVLQTSDLPPGVVNILTGERAELLHHFSTHKDVNAMIYCGDSDEDIRSIQKNSTENLKRIITYDKKWSSSKIQDPYFILDTQEVKTTWHPVGSSY